MTFTEQCETIADELGIEIIDIYDDGTSDGAFEDDGFLHVTQGTIRVAFDVSDNQSVSAAKQNARTRQILRYLDVSVTSDALA